VREGKVPEKRAPWARAGWFDEAAAWVGGELRRAGLAATGPIRQLRTWQRSCLLRAPTTEGVVYFKAVPAMFALETPLTRYLADLYPTQLPEVLAVEPDRHWFLMRDFGGRSLEAFPDLERWEAAVSAYARIQIDCATRIDPLMALGCPDRRLDQLEAAIDALVEDTDLFLPESEEGLLPSQISELRRLAPRLKAMCRELGGFHVPPSLEHGDFYYAQIIETGENSVFIDWSDSSVAHPFFSMYLFFAYGAEEDRFPTLPDAWTRLRDAYLEPWTIFEPMERLLAAFELSQALAAVHGAVFYQQFVLPHLETRQEWEAMAPWLMKRLLKVTPIR
jgi:hypothetical protein